MFERRVEKSSQWVTESEDSFQNFSTVEEDYHERTISEGMHIFWKLRQFLSNVTALFFLLSLFSSIGQHARPQTSLNTDEHHRRIHSARAARVSACCLYVVVVENSHSESLSRERSLSHNLSALLDKCVRL